MSGIKAGVLTTEAGVGAGAIAVLTAFKDLEPHVCICLSTIAAIYVICRTVLKVKA